MQRTITLVTMAIAVIFLLLHFTHPNTSNTVSLTWRKDLHKFTGVMGSYKAPLFCPRDANRVPNSYFVFLHFSYSLDQHKQEVGNGADLDSAIKWAVEIPGYGLQYSAEFDDASLAAVRADLGVDLVSCDRRAHLIV